MLVATTKINVKMSNSRHQIL